MSVPSTRSRSRRPRDMMMSLAVLLVPILAIFGLWQFLASDRQVSVIDPSAAYMEASALKLEVLEPTGLSDDWKPISSGVRVVDGETVMRVGWNAPSGDGLQLIETTGAADALLSEELDATARVNGIETLNGLEWLSYATSDGFKAYLHEGDGITVLIIGNADAGELRELATAVSTS